MKIGIIGAGLSGLTIASHLKTDFEILEKNASCGGLCRSFHKSRYTWDIGGHILFSKNKEILKEMVSLLGHNVIKGRRNNKIYYKGKFIKYPFENGLGELPEEDKKECLDKFLHNRMSNIKPKNFTQWMYKTFGDGITEKYLLPYNKKIWKTPPHQMSAHWVERIPQPPKKDIINSAKGISTEGYKHQLNFYYPKKGGIASLIKILAKKSEKKISCFKVENIRKVDKWHVYSKKGEKVFDKLISTIPLPELIPMLKDVPENVINAVKSLRYNSLILVALGYKKKNNIPYTAVYFPQKEILFHRLCFMENFSKHNAPSTRTLITAEITHNLGGYISRLPGSKFRWYITKNIEKIFGLKRKKDLIFYDIRRFKYAYVVYDVNYQKNIKMIKDYLNKIGIISAGRFGEWEYWNMDKTYEEAKKVAQKINT